MDTDEPVFSPSNRKANGEPVDTEFEHQDPEDPRKVWGGKESWKEKRRLTRHDLDKQSTKLVIFYFMATTEGTLNSRKKMIHLRDGRGDSDVITEGDLEGVDEVHDLPMKTLTEYVFLQAPAILGEQFCHVDCCFCDVYDDVGDTGDPAEREPMSYTFTSAIPDNGPTYRTDKIYMESQFTGKWEIRVQPDLFYEAFENIFSFVTKNKFTYSYSDFFFSPFKKLCPCAMFSGNEITFSCGRTALWCLLALKFGDAALYNASFRIEDVRPDDVFALIDRFAFCKEYYPRIVNVGEKRKEYIRNARASLEPPPPTETESETEDSDIDRMHVGIEFETDSRHDEYSLETGEVYDKIQSTTRVLSTSREKSKKNKNISLEREEIGNSYYLDEHRPKKVPKTANVDHFWNKSYLLGFNVEAYSISSLIVSIKPASTF